MYSRNRFRDSDEPYRIPENYRGNAFGGAHESTEPGPGLPPDDPMPLPSPPRHEHHNKDSTFLSSLLPPKPTGIGGLLHGIGSEELLLLGLLLLLSQGDSDDDILLLLLLLLFYK